MLLIRVRFLRKFIVYVCVSQKIVGATRASSQSFSLVQLTHSNRTCVNIPYSTVEFLQTLAAQYTRKLYNNHKTVLINRVPRMVLIAIFTNFLSKQKMIEEHSYKIIHKLQNYLNFPQLGIYVFGGKPRTSPNNASQTKFVVTRNWGYIFFLKLFLYIHMKNMSLYKRRMRKTYEKIENSCLLS